MEKPAHDQEVQQPLENQPQVAEVPVEKIKKPIWKRWWFWFCLIILFIAIGSGSNGNTKTTTDAGTQPTATPSEVAQTKAPDVPAEYKSALSQATTYANTMHMSKQGVYDQLVSEYGGKFSAQAAQYGIDNVKSDWNANALAKAKSYQDTMHLSPSAVHDQLTSANGEKFTQAEADYAIQHLND